MKIGVISAHFHPEPAAGQRVNELCHALAAAGFKIVVFTATPRTEGLPRCMDAAGGVEVRRLWSPLRSGVGLLRKTVAMAVFHGAAAVGVLTSPEKFDVIVTISTPPLAHVTGACLAAVRKSKHVFWCIDVHPESVIRLGLLKRHSLAARLLTAFSRRALRKCDAIVAVGRCMRDVLVENGAPPARTFVIPMWHRDELADSALIGATDALRSQIGLPPSTFTVMYSGNLGRMHIVDDLLGAAQQLAADPRVCFVISGGGPGMDRVREFQRVYRLPNLHLQELFPEEMLPSVLRLPDVHVATLRPEMRGVSVPGKVYGAMAVGRPVVFIGPRDSEVACTVEEERCGAVVSPGDVEAFVGVLRRLQASPETAREMGRRGRIAFRERYCLSRRCAEWVRLLEAVGGQSRHCNEVAASVS